MLMLKPLQMTPQAIIWIYDIKLCVLVEISLPFTVWKKRAQPKVTLRRLTQDLNIMCVSDSNSYSILYVLLYGGGYCTTPTIYCYTVGVLYCTYVLLYGGGTALPPPYNCTVTVVVQLFFSAFDFRGTWPRFAWCF